MEKKHVWKWTELDFFGGLFYFKVSCTSPLHQIIESMIPVILFSISFSYAAFPDANRTSWGYKGCTEAKETKSDEYASTFL